MYYLHLLLATGFGSGFSPVAPGTAGSLLAAIIIYFFMPVEYFRIADINLYYLFLICLFLLGVISSTKVEHRLGHDAKSIVIDEILGMFIAILYVPLTLNNILYAFVLFRIFDIFKPFPVNLMEKLPKGWGVMTDDLMAGIYAMAVLNLINIIF